LFVEGTFDKQLERLLRACQRDLHRGEFRIETAQQFDLFVFGEFVAGTEDSGL